MGISPLPQRVLPGSNTGDTFGYSVASAGDVNGDGYSDLVVGANGADPAGVYKLVGRACSWVARLGWIHTATHT